MTTQGERSVVDDRLALLTPILVALAANNSDRLITAVLQGKLLSNWGTAFLRISVPEWPNMDLLTEVAVTGNILPADIFTIPVAQTRGQVYLVRRVCSEYQGLWLLVQPQDGSWQTQAQHQASNVQGSSNNNEQNSETSPSPKIGPTQRATSLPASSSSPGDRTHRSQTAVPW